MASIFRDCTLCLCEVVAEQLPEEDKVVFFHDHQNYNYHDHKFTAVWTRIEMSIDFFVKNSLTFC